VNEEHLLLVADCETREQQLSDWERGFIDSLRRHLESGSELTETQAEKLNEVWERVTS
jgi:hypothetical protein